MRPAYSNFWLNLTLQSKKREKKPLARWSHTKVVHAFWTIQDDGSFFMNKNKNSHAVLTRGDTPTSGEGIALVSLLAAAHRVMHDHCALRPRGTRARTGVPALLIDAGPVAGI